MKQMQRQRGAVLFTSLMFLVVVTFIAMASIRSGVLELRMALNDEIRVNAFQQAQALVDWVAATPASTPVVGDEDFKRCTVENTDVDCDLSEAFVADADISAKIADVAGKGGEYSVSVQRTGSENAPCPRGIGTTAVGTGCAPFRVTARYDMADQAGGRVEISEGVLVFVTSNTGRNF